MMNCFETYFDAYYLEPNLYWVQVTMHILLPNSTNFKTFRQFENLVFVIMSTRENICLIARTPLENHDDSEYLRPSQQL